MRRWHVQCRRRVLVLRLPGELHQCLWRIDVHVQLGLQHLGLWRIPRLHPYARHRVESLETRVWACFLMVDRLRRMRNRMHGWHLCERRRLLKYNCACMALSAQIEIDVRADPFAPFAFKLQTAFPARSVLLVPPPAPAARRAARAVLAQPHVLATLATRHPARRSPSSAPVRGPKKPACSACTYATEQRLNNDNAHPCRGRTACAAGTYSSGAGAACTACPSGSTSSTGSSTCTCSPGYSTSGSGSTLVCSGPCMDRPIDGL